MKSVGKSVSLEISILSEVAQIHKEKILHVLHHIWSLAFIVHVCVSFDFVKCSKHGRLKGI